MSFNYAMEFLDGIDLQALVDQYGPQPEARVINIMMQICGSLYEAHAQGLVHRDIKPANLMLNRRGGQPDVVRVLDFGLVKQADSLQKKRDLPVHLSTCHPKLFNRRPWSMRAAICMRWRGGGWDTF